ncbi:hypothetical protein GCM10027341_06150 [Spirosoma knui]
MKVIVCASKLNSQIIMKTNDETVCLVSGKAKATTKDVCRLLAKEGISAIVVEKDKHEINEPEAETTAQHWSGQPGKDLFFNGWKLLF